MTLQPAQARSNNTKKEAMIGSRIEWRLDNQVIAIPPKTKESKNKIPAIMEKPMKLSVELPVPYILVGESMTIQAAANRINWSTTASPKITREPIPTQCHRIPFRSGNTGLGWARTSAVETVRTAPHFRQYSLLIGLGVLHLRHGGWSCLLPITIQHRIYELDG